MFKASCRFHSALSKCTKPSLFRRKERLSKVQITVLLALPAMPNCTKHLHGRVTMEHLSADLADVRAVSLAHTQREMDWTGYFRLDVRIEQGLL